MRGRPLSIGKFVPDAPTAAATPTPAGAGVIGVSSGDLRVRSVQRGVFDIPGLSGVASQDNKGNHDHCLVNSPLRYKGIQGTVMFLRYTPFSQGICSIEHLECPEVPTSDNGENLRGPGVSTTKCSGFAVRQR